eukprot:14639681-Ditylum_brightwellii.AAC.1
MDNYFTLPKVLGKLLDLGIGVVGTAYFRISWYPKELKNGAQENADYNDFFWAVDFLGTIVAFWMDNGMVFVEFCGDKGKVEVEIPNLIDDYNHWMCGVDITDQKISYYHPDFHCIRN